MLKSVLKNKIGLVWPSYDLFSEVWFCDFSQSLESCSSASSEAILNFSKDLKSPVHALFTIFYEKFSFNQVFRSKMPCSFTYHADFCRFLCASHRSWWGGDSSYSSFPPTPGASAPHSNFSLNTSSLTAVGWFAHKFVGDLAHMPWDNGLQKGRESMG